MLEHLPPGNAAQRELAGPWTDEAWILHDVSTQLRRLNAMFFNRNKTKGQAPEAVTPLPTPRDHAVNSAEPSQHQVHQAREHMLAVLNRPNPG